MIPINLKWPISWEKFFGHGHALIGFREFLKYYLYIGEFNFPNQAPIKGLQR